MTDFRSTDGSSFGRETDEENSLQSIEDMISMVAEIGKEPDKNGDGEKQVGIESGDKDGLAGAKSNPITARDRKINVEQQSAREKKRKAETRLHRNAPTLAAIERHIKSENCFSDTLEYEDVSAFDCKIHRYAVERTRGRQDMYFRDETILNGDDPNVEVTPIIMTAEDIAEERLYDQIYQKEEFFAVATKFLKNVTDGAQQMGGPEFVFETKTANWLKRAAGIQRNYDPYERDDNQQGKPLYSDDSDDADGDAISGGASGGNDRRITRRRIQMNRKKRRMERMGKDTENFRILAEVALDLCKHKKSRRTKKGLKQSGSTIHDVTDHEDDIISKAIDEPTSDEPFPSLESIGLSYIYGRGEDIQNRFREHGEEDEPHKIEGSIVPPIVARLGLEFRQRPLRLEEVSKTHQFAHKRKTGATDTARIRKSKKLINTLTNKHARRWAMHEFFYSDLDNEWYKNDGFASDLLKHGLPIDSRTRLTRHEWSLVRRKLRPRSRIFSKKFIAEQLKRRNHYRALVRALQQDSNVKDFAPIAPGTSVTAFSKRSHTIRRGRVLLHDSKEHSYLVQFDDEDSGCDIFKDFEVAIASRKNHITHSHPPLYELHEDILTMKGENNGSTKLIIPNSVAGEEFTRDIERELMISSIAVATEAFERKKAILEALENCANNTSTIEDASWYCSKLLANLDRINSTLETAHTYLQVLYEKVCASPSSKAISLESEVEKVKLDAEIPKSKDFDELVASLESISTKVGNIAISLNNDAGNSNNRSSQYEFLQHDLSGSTSLLLLSNYLAETSSVLASSGIEKTTYSKAMNAALKILFDRYSKHYLRPTRDLSLEIKKLEQESYVEEELKDLRVAVDMLRTEAALATDESRAFELDNAVA